MGEIMEVTKMDIRYKEVFFTVNEKSKYKIPSKLYPVASKKEMALFHQDNTVDFNHPKLINALNRLDVPIGRCYSNSAKITELGRLLQLDLRYYSGWLFKGNDTPKHHAWVVYLHEDGMSIIDSLKERLFQASINQLQEMSMDTDFRKQYATVVKKMQREMPLNSEQIILGQTISGMLYVGSPDTLDHSRKIYNDTMDAFPNHPSYAMEGDNAQGRSKLQEEFHKAGLD